MRHHRRTRRNTRAGCQSHHRAVVDYKDRADEALVKDIQDHVKRTTAPYKYPRVVEFVDELPKTISGKIRRVEIRDKSKK